jgi:hypothetical protein
LLCIFLLERKENTIIFLKKILKKLLTTFKAHAIIILPGSERLKGEPGSVRREKPEEKRAPALIGTGTIQENRAAVRDGSGKTKERVKPDRSRETPENRSTESAKLAGGRRKSSVGAMDNDRRWSGKKILRGKPQVCWSLVYLCPFLDPAMLWAAEFGDKLQVAVFFFVIEAVADDKNIWQIKTLIIYRHFYNAPGFNV